MLIPEVEEKKEDLEIEKDEDTSENKEEAVCQDDKGTIEQLATWTDMTVKYAPAPSKSGAWSPGNKGL